MLLERIYDEDLAHASYIIGCQAEGEALVIDPRRDVGDYLRIAEANGMRIVGVAETHIHADYLSGTRELAAATGATVYVSDEGGQDWTYGADFDGAVRMKDGHEIRFGNVTVKAMHTPGHTPEHMSLLVTDGGQADAPGFMLTGDFVFVGDLGRPDLLDEAAGGVDTRFEGGKALFASLRDRFLTLPDYVQVLPAHGAGSACGKALGAIPTTTVGYERAFAWWAPYLREDDEQGFLDELLAGQPDAHAYFGRMKVQNRDGPAVLGSVPDLVEYTADDLRPELEADRMILVDTRHNSLVHEGTVPRVAQHPRCGEDRELRRVGLQPAGRGAVARAARRFGGGRGAHARPPRTRRDRHGAGDGSARSRDWTWCRRASWRRRIWTTSTGSCCSTCGTRRSTRPVTCRARSSCRAVASCGTRTRCRRTARSSHTARAESAAAWRRAPCAGRAYDIAELDGSYLGWTAIAGDEPVSAEV